MQNDDKSVFHLQVFSYKESLNIDVDFKLI